jgi:hypothetical protein
MPVAVKSPKSTDDALIAAGDMVKTESGDGVLSFGSKSLSFDFMLTHHTDSQRYKSNTLVGQNYEYFEAMGERKK